MPGTFKLGDVSGFRPDVQGCTGKIKYKSRKAAEAALASLLRKPTVKNPDRLNVYRCRCMFWHVGRSATPKSD